VLRRSYSTKIDKNEQIQGFRLVFASFFIVFMSLFSSFAAADDNHTPIAVNSSTSSSIAESPVAPKTVSTPVKTVSIASSVTPKTATSADQAKGHPDTKPEPKTDSETEKTASIPPVEEIIINTTLIAEVDATITVTLDGETLESTEVHRSEDGALYVNVIPIFDALNNDFEYDSELKALIVRRSQDNAVMELYTDTGIVKANGKALGKLKHFGEVREGRFLLTPNAIAVLSGAAGKFDSDSNQFDFELDPRLRVATGFEIFVNDISLVNLNPAPKSVGSVLLLPLLPIAEELGHDVTVLDGTNEIRVRRAQDSAVFSFNLDTGLIKLRDRPYGIAKDVTYIDDINLLLPVSALEALTGTHVEVNGGSNRIDIRLDRRLKDIIKPFGDVEEIAGDTPFTPETLSFHLGPDSLNQVEAQFRAGKINGRLRYEVPDLPTNPKELEPSWLSVDFAHLNGITGSVGDYSADFRELDGVGIRRIRGVSAVKETEKGRWAAAVGQPVNGARRISDDQTRLDFGGVAGGARFASVDGWEAGAAFNVDTLNDDQVAVLSAISGRLGRKRGKKLQWDARGDIGVFNGPARESAVDIAFSGNARYDVNDNITLDGVVEYTGAEFLRTDLDVEEQIEEAAALLTDDNELVAEDEFEPDTRQRGSDEALIGAAVRFSPRKDYGFLERPAVSARAQVRRSGLVTGTESGQDLVTYGANFSTSIKNTGVNLSLSASQSHLTRRIADPIIGPSDIININTNDPLTNIESQDIPSQDLTENSWRYGIRASRDFEHFNVQAQYEKSRLADGPRFDNASVTVTSRSYNVPLPKRARVNITPSATASLNNNNTSLRGGVVANFNSGELLGKKTYLQASLGVLQSTGGVFGSRTDKFLSMTLGRRVPLGRNMSLGLAYRNDLRGNQRIGLQLDGRLEFNESRKYKATEDGRGILKGRVFLDENRDGVKQDAEPGVTRALIQVRGTGLALRSAKAGAFTIQNIKEGVHEIMIDNESLPLGFAMPDDFVGRVSIVDGQITDISVPIVQRGQIRGFTFIDSNGDGEFTTGEERVDGVTLKLDASSGEGEGVKAHTTSFGQFAFDDLSAQSYKISVTENKKANYRPGEPIEIELGQSDNLMVRVKIPLIPRDNIKLVRNTDPPDKTIPNTSVPDPQGPAPP